MEGQNFLPLQGGDGKGSKMTLFKPKSHIWSFWFSYIVFFMLIFHPYPKKAILGTFWAKFGRSKVSPLPEGNSECGQKWQFLSQNSIFGHIDPLNDIFYANFVSCPQHGNTRAKFGGSKDSPLREGDSECSQKWQFLSQNWICGHIDPLNDIFYANFVSCPQQGKTRDFKALSNSWCNTF